MIKVAIYIEKETFDQFYNWIGRLNKGVLADCPIKYSAQNAGFTKPLQLQVEPDVYSLIQDAEADLAYLKKEYGEMELSFEPESGIRDLSTIKNILKNARRNDVEEYVVYTALQTMVEVPGLLPLEAMIISEREWLVDENSNEFRDI
jgi:hypothetical protein